MKDSEFQILLFYKYVFIEDPEIVRAWQENLCKKYHFTGRLIIAKEGINVTLEGKTEDTENYIKELETDARFKNIHFKRSPGTGAAFYKCSVKVRPEIVSGHLGVCDIDPNSITGKRLSPESLHAWINEKKEFYIIDMRNVYEHAVGHFENSICPPLSNFRDLPKIIKQLSHLKNKTVVTVCTGGVRCEKASGFLLTNGFEDVWQLDGGIVSYMERYPNEDFLGKLYVFDKRVMMGFFTDDPKHTIIGTCENCHTSSERFVNCEHLWCGRHFICCEECERENRIASSKNIRTCKNGCSVRKPKKIQSPLTRLWVTIKNMKFKGKSTAGFTMLESLIMITLIIVVSTALYVVLSPLGHSQRKTAAQDTLAETRSQADQFFKVNNSYTGLCGTVVLGGVKPIYPTFQQAALAANAGIVTTNSTSPQAPNQGICWEDASAWIASAPISDNQYYCVDSTQSGHIITSTVPAKTFTCP